MRARFDLLTNFRQGDLSVDQWYNAVQTQVALANYLQETAQILQREIFWFFLNDESFVSKTLNEGHVELNKFSACTVRQLAKKMDSLQTTAKHMKQVTRDPQAVHINLLWHQCTEIPPSKSNKKRKTFKLRQEANKYSDTRKPQENRRHNPECTRQDTCSKCGDSWHREGFRCLANKLQCNICEKIGHFSSLCYQKKDNYNHKKTYGLPKAHQLKLGSMYAKDPLSGQSCYSSEENSFCLQLKVQSSNQAETRCVTPQHLVTNQEYVLEPHQKRTKFLRPRIDICTNVNILPISVYRVLYKDPDCDILVPSNKDGISTYTAEKIQVLGSCDLLVVHPETRCLKEVTFQVVNHEGRVIVSCVTSLELGLTKLHSVSNDSIPDCWRLPYNEADHPGKYQYQNIESSSSVSNNASPIEVQYTIVPDIIEQKLISVWPNGDKRKTS